MELNPARASSFLCIFQLCRGTACDLHQSKRHMQLLVILHRPKFISIGDAFAERMAECGHENLCSAVHSGGTDTSSQTLKATPTHTVGMILC